MTKRYEIQSQGKVTDSTDRLDLAELAAECNATSGARVIDTRTGEVVYEIPEWKAQS